MSAPVAAPATAPIATPLPAFPVWLPTIAPSPAPMAPPATDPTAVVCFGLVHPVSASVATVVRKSVRGERRVDAIDSCYVRYYRLEGLLSRVRISLFVVSVLIFLTPEVIYLLLLFLHALVL